MSNKFANPSYTIAAGRTVSGKLEQARTIQVSGGRVWLTVEGDRNDYFLEAGQTFTLPAGRLLVMEADRHASLIETVGNAAPVTAARRRAALPLHCQAQAA